MNQQRAVRLLVEVGRVALGGRKEASKLLGEAFVILKKNNNKKQN